MEFIGASTFKSDAQLESFEMPFPDGTMAGDLLVATAVAPQHHPETPWPTPVGWAFLQQVVHLGQFSRIAAPGEADVVFKVNPSLGTVETTTAAVLAFRSAPSALPVRANGWAICQKPYDGLCGGNWQGNAQSPCYETGCLRWRAPAVTLSFAATLIYAWAGHVAAEPLTLAHNVTELASTRNARMTLRLGRVDKTAGLTRGSPAIPRPGSNWDHGIATVLAF